MLDVMIVMVGDVLVTGYCAVREWVDERHGEYGMERDIGERKVGQAKVSAIMIEEDNWWAKLGPSVIGHAGRQSSINDIRKFLHSLAGVVQYKGEKNL